MARHAWFPVAAIAAAVLAGVGATYAVVAGQRHPASITGARPLVPPSPRSRPRAAAGPSRPGSPSGTGTELAELEQIAVVLRRSSAIRVTVVATTKSVSTCSLPPAVGLDRMDRALAARQWLIASAGSLPVFAIPAGPELKTELTAALRLSAAAELGFARWMAQMQQSGGCRGPTAAGSYLSGVQESVLAGLVNAKFLRLWDPLAAEFGQRGYASWQI